MIDKNQFLNPDPEYRIKPFWFWNSNLEEAELLRQIVDMKKKGLGGFFIHARFGLETEYLSRKWFELIKECVQKARALSMEVWLYDENPFPSGIGGLKVSSKPEYRNQYIEVEELELAPGANLINSTDGVLKSVQLIKKEGPVPYSRWRPEGKKTIIHCPENNSSRKYRFALFWKKSPDSPDNKIFGINYMNPRAVAEFIELTHEQYARHLGQFFGKTIKGVFTDEPSLLPWHQDINWFLAHQDGRVVAWDEKIYQILKKQTGCSLDHILRAVFYEYNNGNSEFKDQELRKKFWQVTAELYEKNFFTQYQQWCQKHNLKLTGHVLLEEGLHFNTQFQGNIMQNLFHFDIPGIDHLTNTTEENDLCFMVGEAEHLPRNKTNVQGQKTVAGAAHNQGKNEILTESFGLGGWDMTLQDMKKIVNWQFVLGINRLCPHALFYSIEGFRKTDAPPCHRHNLHWKFYRYFADYTARLSYVLSQGLHSAPIAVLYPLNSFQASFIPGKHVEQSQTISDIFDLLCTELLGLHYDYDILAEEKLLTAKIHNKRLMVGDEQFRILLVPVHKALSPKIKNVIKLFKNCGGQVIIFSELLSNNTKKTTSGSNQSAAHNSINRKNVNSLLKKALPEAAPPDVWIKGQDNSFIYYQKRKLSYENIYFFVNNASHTINADIIINQSGQPFIYDSEWGAISPLKNYQIADNRIIFNYSFVPASSLLVGIQSFDQSKNLQKHLYNTIPNTMKSKQNRIENTQFDQYEKKVVLPSEKWSFRLISPNIYPLSNLTLAQDTEKWGTTYYYRAHFRLKKKGLPLKLLLDDIEYRTAFMGTMDLAVKINDKLISGPDGFYIDRKFKTWDLTKAVIKGKNRLEITITHYSWSGQPHLLTTMPKILGQFKIVKYGTYTALDQPDNTLDLGSWTDQGYPFFSGTAVYSTSFTLEKKPKFIVLEFEKIAEYANIEINNKPAGQLIWEPLVLNITPLVVAGPNKISIRITNTLLNFIEHKNKPAGILGKIYLKII